MKPYGSIGLIQYAIVVLLLVVTGISPHDRFTWFLEVSWILVGLVVLWVLNIKGVFPTHLLGWALVIHSMILIYGAYYTYAYVPLGDFVSELMGWERNHYDRFGHFAQGFFPAIFAREVFVRNHVVNGFFWREGLVFACIMAFTGIFEIIEFAAALAFGDGAIDYLGSQGDVWDAQWDMVMCGFGGLISIFAISRWHLSLIQKHCPKPN